MSYMTKAALKYGLWCEWITAILTLWKSSKQGTDQYAFWAEWYWSLVEIEVCES